MDDFEILRDLFRVEVLASTEGHWIFLEEQEDRPYRLTITRTPSDTIAFKADAFPDLKHVFNDSRHECRRADYVIIARNGSERWIVYVEMKRSRRSDPDIKLQLRGARCLVAYSCAIVQEFWAESGFLADYAERFVSVDFKTRKRSKRDRVKSSRGQDPDNVLRLSAPTGVLQFNKLLGAAR